MIERNDFEDYLAEKHADQYAGTDDDMADDYVAWLENLDVQELLDYGQGFADQIERLTATQADVEAFEHEIASNSYLACQHEENEMVLKASRAIEICGEFLKEQEARIRKEERAMFDRVIESVEDAEGSDFFMRLTLEFLASLLPNPEKDE